MHIHILGICGTFMGSLALLARDLGIRVSGSDQSVYPPMSTQLQAQGIQLMEGYEVSHLDPEPDLIVVGNAMKRGNPVVEYVLDRGLAYTSGPQFFAEHILRDKWVLAASGTHGKTTTSSMLAWILEDAGMSPGFLIGGIPANFGISARTGDTDFFVVEADEYDTAFFDKRSKFVHYRPRTLVMNNLEFDHADIFPDLAAIQRQFHHLIRTVPASGRIIAPGNDPVINQVLDMGCWSETEYMSTEQMEEGWSGKPLKDDCSQFEVFYNGSCVGKVSWSQLGWHNLANGLAAIAAARHVGVLPELACEALSRFAGVKRRMELVAEVNGIRVYDDFAHHPTAIATTLEGARKNLSADNEQRIFAVIEPRSNTMKMGCHQDTLAQSVAAASEAIWYQPEDMDWSLESIVENSAVPARIMNSTRAIIEDLVANARSGDQLVIMSNGGFEGIHTRLVKALRDKK